jgi:hypothetical protein
VGEDVLEAQAVEEPLAAADAEAEAPRPLPDRVTSSGELDIWRGEVRTAALAAAGGIVAGAATVAAVRAIRPGPSSRKGVIRRGKARQSVVASRSFLVDVHVLGR